MRQYIWFSSPRQFCINCWKVAGALHSPKGMQSHLKRPRLPMVNAVYCFEDSSILICQNLDFRSRHEKWPAPTKLSNASWILGSGYESFFVWALRHCKSMQKCRPPSLFPNQHHCITPHALAGVNCTWVQHFLQVVTNFLYQWWRYLPKSFFEWSIIGNFNHIFSWMGTTKFTGLQWEDVVVFSQERASGSHQLGWPRFQSSQI